MAFLHSDVLVVSPQPARRDRLRALLEAGGYSSDGVGNILETRVAIKKGSEHGVALVDLGIDSDNQFLVARKVRELSPATQVIIISDKTKIDTALRASNEGVFWLLSEPFENEELLYLIARGLVVHQLARENLALKEAIKPQVGAERLVAHSPVMQHLLTRVQRIATLDASVLITGESGTGKTLLASVLHQNSLKGSGPFISLSCANLPRDLLESELFGHEKGAFTGASTARPGSIELCDGGTLFLDEIGELPIDLQPKLLTFLQDKQVRRIGGRGSKKVDVRIICATNRDIEAAVKNGEFREDLFYRVNVLNLRLPPLRERREDIIPLATQILGAIASRRGSKQSWKLTPPVVDTLLKYAWPGNIRELEHALERATAFSESGEITVSDLEVTRAVQDIVGAASLVGKTLREVEASHILETLKSCGGNKQRAAQLLGISLKTIYNKLKSIPHADLL